MNDNRYRWILQTIVAVIIATIGIQVYWNYKNYQANKQQLLNEVQISLDKAVDDYYAALAERTSFGVFFEGDQQKNAFDKERKLDAILKNINESKKDFSSLDSISSNHIKSITIIKGLKADSMMNRHNNETLKTIKSDSFKIELEELKINNDSLKANNIKLLTSKVLISINNDTLNIKEVDSLLNIELERKNIIVERQLKFYKSNTNLQTSYKPNAILKKEHPRNLALSTTSKSTFLPKGSVLQLNFSDEASLVLKRILSGILISTLLVLAVISCLFYLLKIIKHQKQIAEVKNDLISNITHEFKTPIATISVALESIKNFNVIDNKEKTKTYLDLSIVQLSKLNVMVEKLLETATLDSDNLNLNKETTNITELLHLAAEKHQMQTSTKTIRFNASYKTIIAKIDVFHFENAINNIIDNAIKYGGNNIFISLTQNASTFTVSISDNGNTLSTAHKNSIFEKFYRVPKGNTHDVKGFGIGLYYTKKIVEKHEGTIDLDLDHALTTFKLTLPNA